MAYSLPGSGIIDPHPFTPNRDKSPLESLGLTPATPAPNLVETGHYEDGTADFRGEIAMSPDGTVAFSTLNSGYGFVYRGPGARPVSLLYEGSGDEPVAEE